MRAFKFESDKIGYFEELSENTREVVKALMLKAFDLGVSNASDCYPFSDDDRTNDIECHSRDGFIPYAHNRGGIQVRAFTDLSSIEGSGYFPSAARSRDKIENEISEELVRIREAFFEKHEEVLTALGYGLDDCSYHRLEELEVKHAELKGFTNAFSELEHDYLGSECNSVMYLLQFMYHGKDENGKHSASIAAALNTEAPYHRAGHCELAKEVVITWKTERQLKEKLAKALTKTVNAIF